MSTGELIFRTNRKSVKYAKGCVATSKRNDPRNGRWTFTVKCHQNWSKGPYDVRFRMLKSSKPTVGILGRTIEVSCNCNAWKYNGADFNALEKDYSERQYSNGQPPVVRDPQRRYLICKHIAACVPLFQRFLIPEQFKGPMTPVKKVVTPATPKKVVTPTTPKKPINPRIEKNPLEKPKTMER
jgi:hypothetical protein